MLYIFSTILSILFYALLLVPVGLVVLILHRYVLHGLKRRQLKRAILFVFLLTFITPLQLDSGSGALFDLTVPRPIYTFYLDMIYTGGYEIFLTAIRLNPVFAGFGLVVSVLVCGYLAKRAYR